MEFHLSELEKNFGNAEAIDSLKAVGDLFDSIIKFKERCFKESGIHSKQLNMQSQKENGAAIYAFVFVIKTIKKVIFGGERSDRS